LRLCRNPATGIFANNIRPIATSTTATTATTGVTATTATARNYNVIKGKGWNAKLSGHCVEFFKIS
jgi:hypothetical protein